MNETEVDGIVGARNSIKQHKRIEKGRIIRKEKSIKSNQR